VFSGPSSVRQWFRRIDAFLVLAVAATAIPIVVAVVRAIGDRWIPLGDQALLQIRARDVLTTNHPLLGTASSAALNGSDVVPLNHPGPLMFDLLALPVRVFGDAGVAIGVGVVNLAAAVIGIAFAARRSGRAGIALAALAFACLGWAAGSESLFDPYNPTAAMLPCLACLFVAWAVIDLDGWAVPWLLGVATFAVQLNNSYLLFLTPLVVAACLVFAIRVRHRQRDGMRTMSITAVAVLVVLWSQPLIEQLLHGRDGNMARMLRAAGVLGNHPGPRLGTQIAAATLALPPWWGRSSFDGIRLFSQVPSVAIAAGSMVLVLAVCAVGCRVAWRHRQLDAAAALSTAAIATLIGWVAAIRSPMSSFFGVSSDYVRWLWPASMFVWFAVGLAMWRFAASRVLTFVDRRTLLVVAVLAITAVCVSNVPRHLSLEGQRAFDRLRPTALELIDEASDNIVAPAVLFRPPPNYDVFGVPLLARLQSRGIEFLVDDPVLVRQFGERRRYEGQDVAELRVVTAMDAIDATTNPDLVAFVSQLSARERDDLQTMMIEIETWLREGRITLSEKGTDAVAVGLGEPWLGQLDDPELDATTISRSIALAAAVRAGLLDADPALLATLEQFSTLRQSVETSTVAALLTQPANR
jgi:hypothetical protein